MGMAMSRYGPSIQVRTVKTNVAITTPNTTTTENIVGAEIMSGNHVPAWLISLIIIAFLVFCIGTFFIWKKVRGDTKDISDIEMGNNPAEEGSKASEPRLARFLPFWKWSSPLTPPPTSTEMVEIVEVAPIRFPQNALKHAHGRKAADFAHYRRNNKGVGRQQTPQAINTIQGSGNYSRNENPYPSKPEGFNPYGYGQP
ncbi:hypothetical protein K505DRAFT_334704 [Melanomma pulvis-pyrius CBS 109.77]|uniref:Uncharacterized protein n=1 Tax=Melanomma pulvis-pyrius CBS 109.77 TaxID=1314802 RepID=A0A6A6XLD8_9PLEO|nr:hypothetical protein K505DRAFT_334704 [Melanomma pulvis-pyrius CBS 109.77]